MDNKFYHADAFDLMKEMVVANKKATHIITSPPYFSEQRKGAKDVYNKRYENFAQITNADQYINWLTDLFKEFEKVLTDDGVVLFNINYGSNHPSILNYFVVAVETHTKFKLYDTIQWKKSTAIPNNVSPNRLTRITEPIYVFAKSKDFIANKEIKSTSVTGQKFYENSQNLIVAPNNDGSNNLNKATFSKSLVIQCLEKYATKNETTLVYDPFGGIGTTMDACGEYGVACISSEHDKEQVDFYNEKNILK